jgi:16S rRNA (guanine527-N7)-methyltransferase
LEVLKKYFPDLRKEQLQQYALFQEVFTEWNEKINCVSRKDIENFSERHILHSLAIAKVVHFPSDSTVLDVGTGGGFPGLPLAIMFPGTQFHLVDSIGKKIKVVNGVVEALKLPNVQATKARSEEMKGKYAFITARAVARASTFDHWVRHLFDSKSKIESRGIYYLKGGDVREEMQEVRRPFKIFNISDFFEEEFFETKRVVKF